MIYFLKPFMKYENSENRFSEFSIVKDFAIEFVLCLINSFIINHVCKNLKENVNMKVKSKYKVVFRGICFSRPSALGPRPCNIYKCWF